MLILYRRSFNTAVLQKVSFGIVLLILLYVGPLGCTGVTPPTATQHPELHGSKLETFVGDAALDAYLEKLGALKAEERAFYWKKRDDARKAYAAKRLAEAEQALGTNVAVPDSDTQELIVRGTWAPGLSDTPIAVTQFSAADVQNLRIADVADLASYTPSLEVDTAFDADSTSITNNQESEVDEGDIVKKIGNYILMLRRGELFSFDIGDRAGYPLRRIDRVVLPPENPKLKGEYDAWYDEMLVDGSTVVVIGFNYGINATEIVFFELEPDGRIVRGDTLYIDAHDYYSSSNYASRLVDGELLLYMPIPIESGSKAGEGAEIKWPHRVLLSPAGDFEEPAPLLVDTKIYAPLQPSLYPVLHALLRCPIRVAPFQCSATAIMGPEFEFHYVSRDAFYLWLRSSFWEFDVTNITLEAFRARLESEPPRTSTASLESVLYRVPYGSRLDENEVGVVEVQGNPIDQFSFREADGGLDVFVEREGKEDVAGSRHALWIHIPVVAFQEDLLRWEDVAYKELPLVSHCPVVRFIGDHLVYAEGGCWDDDLHGSRGLVRVLDLQNPSEPFEIELEHFPVRLENLRNYAIIGGYAVDVEGPVPEFSFQLDTLSLPGTPSIVDSTRIYGRFPDESRSHAFNYARWDDGEIIALPLEPINNFDAYDRRVVPSEIHYFDVGPQLDLENLGILRQSRAALELDVECEVPCVDWYGASRPFFIGSRIFALIDYELIEAEISPRGRIREVRRVSALAD